MLSNGEFSWSNNINNIILWVHYRLGDSKLPRSMSITSVIGQTLDDFQSMLLSFSCGLDFVKRVVIDQTVSPPNFVELILNLSGQEPHFRWLPVSEYGSSRAYLVYIERDRSWRLYSTEEERLEHLLASVHHRKPYRQHFRIWKVAEIVAKQKERLTHETCEHADATRLPLRKQMTEFPLSLINRMSLLNEALESLMNRFFTEEICAVFFVRESTLSD